MLVVAMGAVEYFGTDGMVIARDTATTLLERYRHYCGENGIRPADIVD